MLERTAFHLSRAYVVPIIVVTVAVLVAAGIRLLSATSMVPLVPQPEAITADRTRVSEGGEVTVTATWQEPAEKPNFMVVMDTHAVDLDGYDLVQLAALRVDNGPELAPVRWDAPAGGHHREGTLVFPPEYAGKATIDAQSRTVELIIRGVAGVPERIFSWRW